MKKRAVLLLVSLLLMVGNALAQGKAKHTFEIKEGNFVYDGKPTMLYSGEMHYSRVPAPYWRHRLRMMKAMGLNAVTTYVFWNYHEVSPGEWDWKSENRNLREFLRIAQEEDMLVILRPGPYVCSEWDYGGLPWWLQLQEGMKVRENNKPFLDASKEYMGQLARQVQDMQVTHGGPIVMVQAENEFGSYVLHRPDIPLEEHKRYIAAVSQMLLDAGFDVPLFTSDGSWLFEGGTTQGALPTANGENNIEALKKVIDQYNNGMGPYFVAEFYPGWLDHWNEPFQKRPTEAIVNQTKTYIENGVSFNYYMAHGGTSFGFCSGANYNTDNNIQPDITSYDWDAPISEAGWDTEKYHAIREVMQAHVDYELPEVPERIPVIKVGDIRLSQTADVLTMLEKGKPVENATPLNFEQLGQGFGYVLYRRQFNQPISGMMRIPDIADFATVYVNGRKVGQLNRLLELDSLAVDLPFNSTLDVLVENCGRINYGKRITSNNKGILNPVTIDGNEITGGWQMYGLPLTETPDLSASTTECKTGRPAYYRGTFTLKKVGDTFLDMEQWGKGIVFVNGHHLGRYWQVGPQQTLYLPGCWLKKGKNEVVVFEQLNDRRQFALSTVTEPVLDKLVQATTQQETPEEIIDRQAQEINSLREKIDELQRLIDSIKK